MRKIVIGGQIYTTESIQDLRFSIGGNDNFCLIDYHAMSSVKVKGRVGGICRLHLQGRRVNKRRNQNAADIPPKYHVTSNGLRRLMSQKIEPFVINPLVTYTIYPILLICMHKTSRIYNHLCYDRHLTCHRT
jgi:hypothetical protein